MKKNLLMNSLLVWALMLLLGCGNSKENRHATPKLEENVHQEHNLTQNPTTPPETTTPETKTTPPTTTPPASAADIKKALQETVAHPLKDVIYTLDGQGAFVSYEQVKDGETHLFLGYYDLRDAAHPRRVTDIGEYFKNYHLKKLVLVGTNYADIYEAQRRESYQRTYDYVNNVFVFSNKGDKYEVANSLAANISKQVKEHGGSVVHMEYFVALSRMAVMIKSADKYSLWIYDTSDKNAIKRKYMVASIKADAYATSDFKRVMGENKFSYYAAGAKRMFDFANESLLLEIQKQMGEKEVISLEFSADKKEVFVLSKNSKGEMIVEYMDIQNPLNPVFVRALGRYKYIDIVKIQPLPGGFVNLYLSTQDINGDFFDKQATWDYRKGEMLFDSIDVQHGSTRESSIEGRIVKRVQNMGAKVTGMAFMPSVNRMAVSIEKANEKDRLLIYDTNTLMSHVVLQATKISDLQVGDVTKHEVSYRENEQLRTLDVTANTVTNIPSKG